MAENIRNEFTLRYDEENNLVYAKRVLEDKYELVQAFDLLEKTFNHYINMKNFVDNFDEICEQEMDRVRKEKPEETEEYFNKILDTWKNQYHIDKEIELPKLVRELKEYADLADKLSYPVDDDIREVVKNASS